MAAELTAEDAMLFAIQLGMTMAADVVPGVGQFAGDLPTLTVGPEYLPTLTVGPEDLTLVHSGDETEITSVP